MTTRRRYDPSPARAEAIRRAREWAHMSLEDLAGAVGVSRTTVRRWEACTHDPGPEAAARIAVVTGVPVSRLLAPSAASRSPSFPVQGKREAA